MTTPKQRLWQYIVAMICIPGGWASIPGGLGQQTPRDRTYCSWDLQSIGQKDSGSTSRRQPAFYTLQIRDSQDTGVNKLRAADETGAGHEDIDTLEAK
jgi:hypothetical protein